MPIQADLSETALVVQKKFVHLRDAMSKVIVGQHRLIERMIISLLADGHLLLEGLPGLAKTLAVKTMAQAIEGKYQRIQFTPDLLPADLLGTSVYHPQDGTFSVKKGPIFTEILLADEINRAPPKVQSALLEVMGEKQVTLASEKHSFGELFMVLATQNPVEHEGTYPLPEAQTDRFFMKVLIDYPTTDEEKEIVKRFGSRQEPPPISSVMTLDNLREGRKFVHQIFIDPLVVDYLIHIVEATRYPTTKGVPIEGLLEFGASPRASISLNIASKAHAFLDGRGYVAPQDIKAVAHDVLRHRIRLSYEAEAEGLTCDDIIDKVLQNVPTP